MSVHDRRPGDISREEFHETIQNWLDTYRPLRDAHRKNDKSEIVIPFAPGKFKDYWVKRLLGDTESNDFVSFAVDALHHHNEDKLAVMMRNGVNPGAALDRASGRSLLHHAVLKGDLKKVTYLLQFCSKTGVNYADLDGRTAFHLSINVPVYFHSLLITKALFRHHADVNTADRLGQTPLHRACILGELSFVEELLSRGARVEPKDAADRVPLECCKQGSFKDAVLKLIKSRKRTKRHLKQERRMWAHIMSKGVVKNVFSLIGQSCGMCKQSYVKCNGLKKENFRRWYLVHRVPH